ncbi:DUF2946 family protein [Roseomonas sp. AR75]|uniref:DUF2946 family protein n=1 Tax=Roseomonas sp. AR75 TaxID=2562311 RepID=UPI0010BFFEA0|nr:DUF2946 family protein [Roseomonas sp. AR75]
MALNRPILRLLIALALCLQSSLAMAHCLVLARASASFEVLICTADGLVSVDLGHHDGTTDHDHADGPVTCPACLAPAQFVLAAPPELPLPQVLPAPVPELRIVAAPPPPARAPPYRPTGPPALS